MGDVASSPGFTVAHLSEIAVSLNSAWSSWAPIRSYFDIGAFGINAWHAAEAGQLVVMESTLCAKRSHSTRQESGRMPQGTRTWSRFTGSPEFEELMKA